MIFLHTLRPWAIVGEWFRGITGAAADPLPQLGQLGGKCDELEPTLLIFLPECKNLLLLNDSQRSGAGRRYQTVRFSNPARGC